MISIQFGHSILKHRDLLPYLAYLFRVKIGPDDLLTPSGLGEHSSIWSDKGGIPGKLSSPRDSATIAGGNVHLVLYSS